MKKSYNNGQLMKIPTGFFTKQNFWLYVRQFFLLISLIILCSCGAAEEKNTEEESLPEVVVQTEVLKEPQANKDITVSMRTPKTLNPLLNEDITVDRTCKLIFEDLLTIDEFQKPMPNLAESYKFSEDGLVITVVLKNDILWHNGEHLTAYDVEFSINTIKSAGDGSIYKKKITNINSCNVVDDRTINIVYNSVYGGNAYSLDFPIIPKSYYGVEHDSLKPVGCGAYKFEYYERDKEMTLVANENYFKGKALIDKIFVYLTPNIEADKTSFEHGIIDVITSNIVDLGKYRGSMETNYTAFNTMYYDFIGFNYDNPVFSDKNIRKSIAHIISKDEIIESVYLGHALSTLMPINPNSWLYEPELSDFNFNSKLSEELIIESGYTAGEEGILTKTTETGKLTLNFRILVNLENAERVKLADILKKNLAAIGVKSEIINVPFEEYNSKIANREFDIIIGGYNLDVFPDLTFLFETSSIEKGTNIFKYSNPEMDAKLSMVRSSKNDQELKANIKDIQRLIAEEIPCISIVFRNSALLTNKNIYGEIMPTINNVYNNIQQWFVYDEE